jgi:hypothetical protein
MSFVHLLWHVREDDPTTASWKLIGCFSTNEKASAAITLLRSKPGFVNHPQGFHIDSYAVDKVYWEDGFGLAPEE